MKAKKSHSLLNLCLKENLCLIKCWALYGESVQAHSESAVLGDGCAAGVLYSWNLDFIRWDWISAFHPSTNPSPQKRQAGKFYQKIKIWLHVESWLWLELPLRAQVHISNAASTYGIGWQLGIPWQGYLSSKSTNTVRSTFVWVKNKNVKVPYLKLFTLFIIHKSLITPSFNKIILKEPAKSAQEILSVLWLQ